MKRQTTEQWDAGYVRVSTDMQVERDALQNQVQTLEAYALAHGQNLRLYRDGGISAKDTDRPDLQRLLDDVRAGRVRMILVTKLDRISRSLFDLLELMRLFEQHGVKFVSLRDNIDTSGPVGRFMLHILGAIAELERGITGERVAEDMKPRARRGKWNGGLSPYGRRVEDGQLTIVPEEAAVLHRMRELLLETRTWRGVAVALNRASLRTCGWAPLEREGRVVRKGHAPGEWTPVSVVERTVIQELCRLALDRERVVELAGQAGATYEIALQPLVQRRTKATAELERIMARLGSLLELAEDRLVTKQEYAARRAQLEAERGALESEVAALENDIAARAAVTIDPTRRCVACGASATPSTKWTTCSTDGACSLRA